VAKCPTSLRNSEDFRLISVRLLARPRTIAHGAVGNPYRAVASYVSRAVPPGRNAPHYHAPPFVYSWKCSYPISREAALDRIGSRRRPSRTADRPLAQQGRFQEARRHHLFSAQGLLPLTNLFRRLVRDTAPSAAIPATPAAHTITRIEVLSVSPARRKTGLHRSAFQSRRQALNCFSPRCREPPRPRLQVHSASRARPCCELCCAIRPLLPASEPVP